MFIDNIHGLGEDIFSHLFRSKPCLKAEELNSIESLENITW